MIRLTIEIDEAHGIVHVTGSSPIKEPATQFEHGLMLELDTIAYSRAEAYFGAKPVFEQTLKVDREVAK